jgi:hypothetical protein
MANLAAPKSQTPTALSSLFSHDGAIRLVVAAPQDDEYIPYDQDADAQREAAEIAADSFRNQPGQPLPSARQTTVRKPFRYTPPPVGSNSVTQLGGKLLALQLLFLVALTAVVGAAAVSNDAPIIGDAILCWGVARWQYIVGKLTARVAVTVGLLFVVALPAFWLFATRAKTDTQFYAALGAVAACGMVLGSAAVVGVCAGVWFRTPIRASIAALAVVMGVGVLATVIGAPEFSPTVMAGYFPHALAGDPDGVHSRLPLASVGFGALVAAASTVKFLWADL